MARTPSPAVRKSPAVVFRSEIEKAVSEGVALDDMILRLTLNDASRIRRDSSLGVADISFAGGVMRFLGVKVVSGGIDVSALESQAERAAD